MTARVGWTNEKKKVIKERGGKYMLEKLVKSDLSVTYKEGET